MSYRKGEHTFRMNERDFPHLVDIDIPDGGLRDRLRKMHDWHRERGLRDYRGGGGISVSRWCFSSPETADAFAQKFDGRRLPSPKSKPRDPYAFLLSIEQIK